MTSAQNKFVLERVVLTGLLVFTKQVSYESDIIHKYAHKYKFVSEQLFTDQGLIYSRDKIIMNAPVFYNKVNTVLYKHYLVMFKGV